MVSLCFPRDLRGVLENALMYTARAISASISNILFPRRPLFFLGSYVLISKPQVPCGIYLNLRVSTFHAQARVLTFGFYKTGRLWRLYMCLFWSFGYLLMVFPGGLPGCYVIWGKSRYVVYSCKWCSPRLVVPEDKVYVVT